jgi:hypothetical protein
MRLLELFSGTGSIGRAFEQWEVVSLDMDPTSGACIITDFMAWDFSMYPQGYFDAIWASPPCTHYSRARTNAKTPRDLEGSDNLVQRVLDVIEYFQPKVWAFENPASGLLPQRQVVRGLPYHVISYCKYGYPYQKHTAIWTNSQVWKPRAKCCKANPCESLQGGRHIMSAQRGTGLKDGVRDRADKCSLQQLYSMPPELCKELAEAFTEEVC